MIKPTLLVAFFLTAQSLVACAPMAGSRAVRSSGDVLTRSGIATQAGELPVLPARGRREARVELGTGGGPQDVATYEQRVWERLSRVEQGVRDDIDRGVLSAEALDELDAVRGTIRALLSVSAEDGVVSADEQEHIGMQLRDVEASTRQYVATNTVSPGGPRYWR